MIVDHRTYNVKPGKLNEFLKLYESVILPVQPGKLCTSPACALRQVRMAASRATPPRLEPLQGARRRRRRT